MTTLKVAAFLMLIVAAHSRTPGQQSIHGGSYVRKYEEALIRGELNKQAQALRDPVKRSATSKSVDVLLHSSKTQADVTILDKHVVITGFNQSGMPKVSNYVAYVQYYDSAKWTGQTRGIHVIVLDQITGRVVSYDVFDTFGDGSSSLVAHLSGIGNGRIVCFAILDEGSANLSAEARSAIRSLGSTQISLLAYRDTWTFVTVKGRNALGEGIQRKQSSENWARDLYLRVNVPLSGPFV